MIGFWLSAGVLAVLAALAVLWRARAAPVPSADAADLRQLDELDSLKVRGLMDEDAWRSARTEAARRLLAMSGDAAPLAPNPRHGRLVLGAVAATALAALGLYYLTGTPGAPDQPYAQRVDEWAANLEGLDAPRLAAVAARVAADNPQDREAQLFLGRARFEAGDPIGAATAFRRALALDANDALAWTRLGESLTGAQQGVVGADAEAAFRRALQIDPGIPAPRYFLGRAALARGDVETARALWEPLLAELPPGDPRRDQLAADLAAAN